MSYCETKDQDDGSNRQEASGQLTGDGVGQRDFRPVLQRQYVEIYSWLLQTTVRIAENPTERHKSVLSKAENKTAIVEGASSVEEI